MPCAADLRSRGGKAWAEGVGGRKVSGSRDCTQTGWGVIRDISGLSRCWAWICFPARLSHSTTSKKCCNAVCPTNSGVVEWFVQWPCGSMFMSFIPQMHLFVGLGMQAYSRVAVLVSGLDDALCVFGFWCWGPNAAPLFFWLRKFLRKAVLAVYHCGFPVPSDVTTARAQYVWFPRSICWHFCLRPQSEHHLIEAALWECWSAYAQLCSAACRIVAALIGITWQTFIIEVLRRSFPDRSSNLAGNHLR